MPPRATRSRLARRSIGARATLVSDREHELRPGDVMIGADRNDRGADRRELEDARAPRMVVLVDRHADDAAGAERLGLDLHALHRELARVVERLRDVDELGIRGRLALRTLADVVDAVAHHEPERAIAGVHQRPEILSR